MTKVTSPTFVSTFKPPVKCRARKMTLHSKTQTPHLSVQCPTVPLIRIGLTTSASRSLSWRKKQIKESNKKKRWLTSSNKATWSRWKVDDLSKWQRHLFVPHWMGSDYPEKSKFTRTVFVTNLLALRKSVSGMACSDLRGPDCCYQTFSSAISNTFSSNLVTMSCWSSSTCTLGLPL